MSRVFSVVSVLASLGLVGCGAATMVSQNISAPVNTAEPQAAKEVQVSKPTVRVENVAVTEKIPYTTTTVEDNTLAKGTTKVLTNGADGERTKVYKVTYEDNKEIGRELVSSTITREPINKVIANGTYVAPKQVAPSTQCQNGTYVNVDGNTVCRPSSNNSGGATAICRDGTYSYSQHRSGTCSHHGGVRTWL